MRLGARRKSLDRNAHACRSRAWEHDQTSPVEGYSTSVVIIAPGSAHRSTADKTRHSLFIHSFGFTAALILVGLVNSGSGMCMEQGILDFWIGKVQRHHHSYEIASGSVKVANS